MINEPRSYRQSALSIGLIIFVFAVLGIVFLTIIERTNNLILIPFAGLFGIVLVTVLYSMTQKTIISDDEISTHSFFGEKSLRWGEISRVSGRGYAIKLHNFDGDVTVAPSQQLPGYEELVEWIGIKRPDLFNALEYGEMKRSWTASALLVVFMAFLVAALLGSGILFFNQSESSEVIFLPLFFIIMIAAVFFGIAFSSPQLVRLNGKSLFVKYLFSEKTLLAGEIVSVELRFTQTRNGKNYFVALTLANKKVIRLSGLSPNLPVAYLVLKNWHKKNAQNGLTTQRN